MSDRFRVRIDVPPNVTITDKNLPRIVAAAVRSLGETVYVYEDGWNGTLLLTNDLKAEPEIGAELLLIMSPSARKAKVARTRKG